MIAEGSQKLASVPSGGSGGGAPAAGGAAAGGAAAEDAPAEEKEEGTSNRRSSLQIYANYLCREGGVRRGHGFRSFRLSNQYPSQTQISHEIPMLNGQGSWKKLCGFCLSVAYHGSIGLGYTNLLRSRLRYA